MLDVEQPAVRPECSSEPKGKLFSDSDKYCSGMSR